MKFTFLCVYETSHFILNTLNNTTKMAPLVTPVDVYCLILSLPLQGAVQFSHMLSNKWLLTHSMNPTKELAELQMFGLFCFLGFLLPTMVSDYNS